LVDKVARISKREIALTIGSLCSSALISVFLFYIGFYAPTREENERLALQIKEKSDNLEVLKVSKEDLTRKLEDANKRLDESEDKALETLLGGSDKIFPLEKQRLLVHDGDTVRYNISSADVPRYINIRLGGIDTAEFEYRGKKGNDQYGIGPNSNINYGALAKRELQKIIESAANIGLVYAGPGMYGRPVGFLVVYTLGESGAPDNLRLVQVDLVKAGLAAVSLTPDQIKSYPAYAVLITQAYSANQPLGFDDPAKWRHNQNSGGKNLSGQ